MTIAKIKEIADLIKESINSVIIGKEDITEMMVLSLFAQGSVLIEDNPGTGKTMMAKAMAKSLDLKFNRVQFTPDLLPSDITGVNIYDPKVCEFKFIPGPAFTNILLADEINRATPRTQSSLLECMEEKQVTTDGITRKMDNPFFIIATENPIEAIGTYPLPQAQLDRFFICLSMGKATKENELNILNHYHNFSPIDNVKPVVNKETLKDIQESLGDIFVSPSVMQYIVDIIDATRNNSSISLGVSTRGTLALLKASICFAAINGNDYVTPDDVKKMSMYVLPHRIVLVNSYNSLSNRKDIIRTILNKVSAPVENWKSK